METRVNGAEVQARGSRKRRQEGRRHSRNKGRERLEARMDKAVPGHIISFLRPLCYMQSTQGRTKQHIEEATRTRVVIADRRVHVLGSVSGIQQVSYKISLLSSTITTKSNHHQQQLDLKDKM